VAGVNLRTIQKLREKPEHHTREELTHKGAMVVEDELMDIWTNPGEEHDMKHLRVLTVLSNMQTMSAQGVTGGADDSAGGGGVADGDMEELERNLAKAGRNNTIKVPKGFQMTTLDKFEELGFSLTGPGAKRKSRLYGNADDEGEEGSQAGSQRSSSKGRLPVLPQTYRVYKPPTDAKPSTVVPPKPVRRDFHSDEAKKSYGNLAGQMKKWDETSASSGHMIGTNPFGGAIVDEDGDPFVMKDFAKNAPEGFVLETVEGGGGPEFDDTSMMEDSVGTADNI
jgi:hypothetical protein